MINPRINHLGVFDLFDEVILAVENCRWEYQYVNYTLAVDDSSRLFEHK